MEYEGFNGTKFVIQRREGEREREGGSSSTGGLGRVVFRGCRTCERWR